MIKYLTFTAIYIFIPSLPVTHGLGLVAHLPPSARAKHLLLYPLKGGRHHCIFQIISWAVWAVSILVAVPVLVRSPVLKVPASHTEILSAAAAVGSVFAELFMIQSLLVFDPKVPVIAKSGDDLDEPASPTWNRSRIGYRVVYCPVPGLTAIIQCIAEGKQVPSKPLAAKTVVAMGALWVGMGGALVWATEYLEDINTKLVYIVLSVACLVVGVLTTYGLGGRLVHSHRFAQEPAASWRFFQPFRGGAAFVATQALGWLLFSVALVNLFWLITQVAIGMAYCIRCWALSTLGVMTAAYVVLSTSIWFYKGQGLSSAMAAAGERIAAAPKAVTPRPHVWLPILAFYTPVHLFCCCVALTYAVAPAVYATAAWGGALVLYYILTSAGAPEHTGNREWPWLKNWVTSHLPAALVAWFGHLEVIYEGSTPLSPDGRYVFGYQPHGLFPIGGPYVTLLPRFQELLPGVRPIPLIASVCFHTPVVRDICSWCGVRQVTKRTFVKALHERGAVILVPGGQAELVLTWRMFRRRELALYTRHYGFVRLAIEQGAALVPVLCLGEINCVRNLIDWPWLQQTTYKRLGFPIPYLVVGRWGLSPFPRRTGLRFVIGDPIPPPPHVAGTEVATEAVEALHARYYAAVEALFRKHQPSFPGYEDIKLVHV